MNISGNVVNFFMSAVTPAGFVTGLSELIHDPLTKRVFLVKGGAGSGKSTLIKKAAERALGAGETAELIHCSADALSLDAAFLSDGTVLVDATSPHNIVPLFPGAFEKIVTLYDFFDNELLSSQLEEMKEISEKETVYYSRAQSFIRAAGMLLGNNEVLAARCLDAEKLSNYIARLCMREIKRKKERSEIGTERVRYLSTLCKDGVFMFTDTAQRLCERLYIIEDDCTAASAVILEELRHACLSAGYDIYSCPCPMSAHGRMEHLFIPELSLGFLTSDRFHRISIAGAKIIRARRFYDCDLLREYRARSSFQKRAAAELLKEASRLIEIKNECHKKLEEYYIAACNFDAREEYLKEFLRELKF